VGVAKVGHTGTLDPFATGVLLCCLNQATRIARFFLHGTKRYTALLRLGIATDTQDGTGQVIARHAVSDFSEECLMSVFRRFEGCQMQRPPVYAALKHEGTPLYKLARRGTPVQKPARQVTLALRIVETALPDIRFEVCCSAGTYVRALCADIGEALGCGGHLAELRRTGCGGFTLDAAISLEALKRTAPEDVRSEVVPMADALPDMPLIRADGAMVQHLMHGKPLPAEWIQRDIDANEPVGGGYFKVVDEQGRLRAVLQAADEGAKYNYCCVFN